MRTCVNNGFKSEKSDDKLLAVGWKSTGKAALPTKLTRVTQQYLLERSKEKKKIQIPY